MTGGNHLLDTALTIRNMHTPAAAAADGRHASASVQDEASWPTRDQHARL